MSSACWNRLDTFPEIKVTRWDLGRLDHLLVNHSGIRSSWAAELLVRKLMAATVMSEAEIPPLTVTLGSRVEYYDPHEGTHRVSTIVHPYELDFYDDGISILSPVGAVLLGLSEGQSMDYAASGGTPKIITVKKILHQPEASRRNRA